MEKKYMIEHGEVKREFEDKRITDTLKYHEECYIDESFISESRWEIQNMNEYIISILKNMAMTPFIVADNEKCLLNAKDEESKKYFRDVLYKKGKSKTTTDSINRQLTIYKAFFKNLIAIPAGKYTIDGTPVTIYEGTFFKDLPESIQNIILSRKIPVVTIEQATRKQLGEVFRAVNNGVQQNRQEYRQSNFVDNAQPIRDVAKKHKSKFVDDWGVVESKDVNRRFVDELILDYGIFVYENGFGDSNLNPKKRDSFYESEKGDVLVSPVKNTVNGILEKISIPKVKKGGADLRLLRTNFFVRAILKKNNYGIEDEKKFNDWFYEKHMEFMNDKTLEYESNSGVKRPYSSSGGKSTPIAKWNLCLFIKALSQVDYLIYDKSKDRLFSVPQRYEMWKRQGGKSAVKTFDDDGNHTYAKIPLEELLDTEKWHADHYPERYVDGGATEVDNGRIIEKNYNQKTANIKGQITTKKIDLTNIPI